MTSTKTPVSTLMDRQQRHALGMRKAEAYALKNPKAPPPKKEAEKKPDFSSGPRPLTPQEIESLQKSSREASEANQDYFRKLLGVE
jgi:hypothetical protein